MTALHLHATIEFVTITVPNYIKDISIMNTAAETMFKTSWLGVGQVLRQIVAVQTVHHLDIYGGLRLAPAACDIKYGPNNFLYGNVNEQHVQVTLADTSSSIVDVLDSTMVIRKQSEEQIEERQEWRSNIDRMLHDFIWRNLSNRSSQKKSRDLRAIVIGGEAHQVMIDSVTNMIRALLPSHRGSIRDEITPAFIGAVEAAH